MIKKIVIIYEWCLNQIIKEYEQEDHTTGKRSKHPNYEKTPKLVVMRHPHNTSKTYELTNGLWSFNVMV